MININGSDRPIKSELKAFERLPYPMLLGTVSGSLSRAFLFGGRNGGE
jgi:hypothetical protein